MPMPAEYQRAQDEFIAFLTDARETADLGSTHQTYTMAQGVLQAFRRRLSLADAIRFAGALPVGLRALFVADWDPEEPQRPFGDHAAMTREVQALRPRHNFAPATSIRAVARAVRKHVDEAEFDRVLAALPEGAVEFWRA